MYKVLCAVHLRMRFGGHKMLEFIFIRNCEFFKMTE